MDKDFVKYSYETGLGDILFVNQSKPCCYRFYRIGEDWNHSYMIEFDSDSGNHRIYKGSDKDQKGRIMGFDLLTSEDGRDKWKQLNIFRYTYLLKEILKNNIS